MTTPDKEEMPTDIRTAGDFWAEKRDGRWQLQMRHRGPGSSFCVAQINHWADNPEALTTRIADACNAYEPMRKALEKVMVGGNHLGLIIGVDHPPHTASHEEARTHYADAIWTYEAWCCWKTIMEARPALSTLPVIDRQTSDDVGRLREALEATTAEIERDLNDYLSSVCVVRDDVPDRSTMEPEDAEEAARLEEVISRARAALKGIPKPATAPFSGDLVEARRLADQLLTMAARRSIETQFGCATSLMDENRAALSAPSTEKVRG